MMTMKEKREDTFYLFFLVNISEDSGLNGEYENKLFRTYTQARQFMESCIEIEMSVQESENHCSGMLERVGNDMANLWLNTDYSEGVTYRISNVSPI